MKDLRKSAETISPSQRCRRRRGKEGRGATSHIAAPHPPPPLLPALVQEEGTEEGQLSRCKSFLSSTRVGQVLSLKSVPCHATVPSKKGH